MAAHHEELMKSLIPRKKRRKILAIRDRPIVPILETPKTNLLTSSKKILMIKKQDKTMTMLMWRGQPPELMVR